MRVNSSDEVLKHDLPLLSRHRVLLEVRHTNLTSGFQGDAVSNEEGLDVLQEIFAIGRTLELEHLQQCITVESVQNRGNIVCKICILKDSTLIN